MKKRLLYILLVTLSIGPVLFSSQGSAKSANGNSVPYVSNPVDNDADAVVYPNPSIDHIFVRLDLISPELGNYAFDFEIRSILGNMMPVKAERVDTYNYRIDTGDYPSGYYLLMIRCQDCSTEKGNFKKVFKFLKQ